jgi:hypothetical protein
MEALDLRANWRLASDYPHVGDLVGWHWAWEFLRRNNEYQRDHEQFASGESCPKGSIHRYECFPPAAPSETMASYKRQHGEWSMFPRAMVIRDRWALQRPVSPTTRWNELTASPFTRPAQIVKAHKGSLRDAPIERRAWPGEVLFRVRLFGDVASQLDHIKKNASKLQNEYLDGATAITKLEDEYHFILRVYDVQREAKVLNRRPQLTELRSLIGKETEELTRMGGSAEVFIDRVTNPQSKRFNQEYEQYAERLIGQRQYLRLLDYESRRPTLPVD